MLNDRSKISNKGNRDNRVRKFGYSAYPHNDYHLSRNCLIKNKGNARGRSSRPESMRASMHLLKTATLLYTHVKVFHVARLFQLIK